MAEQPKAVVVILIDRKTFSKHVMMVTPLPAQIRLPIEDPKTGEETVYVFQVVEQRDGVVVYMEVSEESRLIQIPTGTNLL